VKPLDEGPLDPRSWGPGSVPAAIAGRIDAKEWSSLPDEARYVLLKLGDPKRDPAKFNLALGELRQT
jgi:hypothetical protein